MTNVLQKNRQYNWGQTPFVLFFLKNFHILIKFPPKSTKGSVPNCTVLLISSVLQGEIQVPEYRSL